ncbi:GL23172 [Drosophila persimilis]|uniref:GL23172 n=1 Tax=Drosophila persimilis TaxID=7234 RepID=B4G5G5_DROPE|nr:GL23172 [Drosophila persimilis]
MLNTANLLCFARGIYHNEFQWTLGKSFAFFFTGVLLAKKLVGLELMPDVGPA